MAGRRQHFIPQALLRGFDAAKGKKAQVYVFKRGQQPYLAAIDRVAAQRDFYSTPSAEQTLDDQITDYESKVLGPAIAALRQAPAGAIEADIAAAAIVHLAIRSAFVRGVFATAATEALDHLRHEMRDADSARALLEVDSPNSDSMLAKTIDQELLPLLEVIPEGGRKAVARLAHFLAREKFSKAFVDVAINAKHQLTVLLESVPVFTANGHGKALESSLAPEMRVEHLKAMNWRIVEAEAPDRFILPDCLAVGVTAAKLEAMDMEPYAFLGNSELAGVAMPVSSSKVLVGSVSSMEVSAVQLNRAFARCSLDFVVSSSADDQTSEAAKLIGTSVVGFVDSLVDKHAVASLEPAKSRGYGEVPARELGRQGVLLSTPISFEPSGRKSSKAQALVRELLSEPSLQLGMSVVDRIVLTDNVARSLRQRGAAPNAFTAQFVASGACLARETTGALACQLFIPTELVNQLAGARSADSNAAAMIRRQAGRATYYAAIVARIPRETLQRQRPLLEAICWRIAHHYCSDYFGGRLAGSVDELYSPASFSQADERFGQILAQCFRGISAARSHFLTHCDVDAALSQALTHVQNFLCASADISAANGGDVTRWRESNSMAALKSVGLENWFEVFARDLDRFFSMRDRLSDDRDLVLLGSHVERVLWSFGIVLSTHSPEQVRMDVMFDEQIEAVRGMFSA